MHHRRLIRMPYWPVRLPDKASRLGPSIHVRVDRATAQGVPRLLWHCKTCAPIQQPELAPDSQSTTTRYDLALNHFETRLNTLMTMNMCWQRL